MTTTKIETALDTVPIAPAPVTRGLKFYARGSWLFFRKMWPAIYNLTTSETYVYASSIAFNILLSFFSFLVLLGSFLVNVLKWQQGYETSYRLLLMLVPAQSKLLFESLDQVTRGPGGKATAVSFALLIFSSSGIFLPLELALNRAWGFKERSVIRQYLLYLPLVLVGGVILLCAVALASVWDYALAAVLGNMAIRQYLFLVIGTLILLPFLVLLLFVVYYTVPHGKVSATQTFFTAAATGVLLVLSSFVFRLLLPLLDFKGSYQHLSSLMALVTWVFVSAFILILGANLAARDVLPRTWTRTGAPQDA